MHGSHHTAGAQASHAEFTNTHNLQQNNIYNNPHTAMSTAGARQPPPLVSHVAAVLWCDGC
jgi:hypothetical protein